MNFADGIKAGAIGGLAGGLVMTMAMVMGKRAGIIDVPLPVRVERYLEGRLKTAGPEIPPDEMALSMGGHLLFSAVLGALYGVIGLTLRLPLLPYGPLYGLGLYVVNLLGFGPMLGITKGPWGEQPITVGRRIMMHLMFGLVTALMVNRSLSQKS